MVNNNLSLGATMEKLTERPYTTQVSYGEDPINNTMYGIDANYKSELPGLTRLLNRLPNYSSKVMSSINAYGEAATLKPGQPSQISSSIYIDNFESSTSAYDLSTPLTSWVLASTPAGNGLFPEATMSDSLGYGYNRAKIAWYNIEATLQSRSNTNNPLRQNLSALSDLRTRAVYNNELFPTQNTTTSNTQLTTFDMSYYPRDRGPYNYNTSRSELNANGQFINPRTKWGGIMRAITQTDFETSNIGYIEFWVQDPFLYNKNSTGGKMIFNLGDVSEDVLKDGKHFYENGLSTPSSITSEDSSTIWGKTPLNPIQQTTAFSSISVTDRSYQDVGFDGLSDDNEKIKRAAYLEDIAQKFGTSSEFYRKAASDPSNDNYIWYRNASFSAQDGILERYKNYNNPQGNSAVATGTSSSAATSYPDNEDLNGDNNLNETESYFQYTINLKPNMAVGDSFIVDKRVITPTLLNDSTATETWYQFRIPVDNYSSKIGTISDFKSIRFIRMYLTDFEDSVTMRFARLNLVRNSWRNFSYYLDTTGAYKSLSSDSTTSLTVSSVDLEDNSARLPIPYKLPPGLERIQTVANNGVNVLSNEQSMSLRVLNLNKGESRAAMKGMNLDLRRYGQMSMWVHAESITGSRSVNDNELNLVLRIGQDYLTNYYEIKMPLKITAPSSAASAAEIWPDSNALNLQLQDLVQLKLRRNSGGHSTSTIFRETDSTGRTLSVFGNPNLAEVSSFLIGVENPSTPEALSAEVWLDELKLSQIDNQGGSAALGRVDVQLADLGTISVSANTYTAGWGSLDQSTNSRSMSSMMQFDAAANLNFGKLFPSKLSFSIPVYASFNRTVYTPKYDPYDEDVLLKTKLAMAANQAEKDSIKRVALTQSTTKMINFSNVRFGTSMGPAKLWSLSNFDFSYSMTKITQSAPTVTANNITTRRGGIGYTFNGQNHFYYPFKNLIKSKSKGLAFLRDFNFNPTPSLLSFRIVADRQMGMYVPRSISLTDSGYRNMQTDTTYDKYFLMYRYYNMRWQMFSRFNIDYSATNNSIVDEPEGLINTKAKRDSIWKNFWKGGRTLTFSQRTNVSYVLPFDKLPVSDWISAQYNFSTTFNYTAASLLAKDLGNTIENSRQGALQADIDFTKLYNKSKFLKATTQSASQNNNANNYLLPPDQQTATTQNIVIPKGISDTAHMILPARDSVVKGLHGAEKRLALQKWRALRRAIRKAKRIEKALLRQYHPNGLVSTGVQLLTMVKHVNLSYSSTYNSRVPGITTAPNMLGNNWRSNSPGLGYSLLGKQPNSAWLENMANRGLLSRDSLFNDIFTQNYTQTLQVNAQLQPIRYLNIDLSLQKSFSQSYNELFKDTLGSGSFQHLDPYASGGFSISYISLKTLFSKTSRTQESKLFENFSSFRKIISGRMGRLNGYSTGTTSSTGYATGYGEYSQDVLIPAFLAAYTGKDPNTVTLVNEEYKSITSSPLALLPLPNWNINYTGLSHMAPFSSIFSGITLRHAYSGTLEMNSFTSNLNYYDPLRLGTPGFINTSTGNYVPFYVIPNLTISESFAPLIGLDLTTKSQNNIRFQYAKSRVLSLSLTDYQVSEVHSTTYTIGGSWRKRNANFSFLPGSKKARNGNDLNISLDLAYRNDLTFNSVLDQTSAYTTGGQKVISISPSIDYILNDRINLKLYFDQQRVIPYISTTYPTTTTSAGIQIRVSLANQ